MDPKINFNFNKLESPNHYGGLPYYKISSPLAQVEFRIHTPHTDPEKYDKQKYILSIEKFDSNFNPFHLKPLFEMLRSLAKYIIVHNVDDKISFWIECAQQKYVDSLYGGYPGEFRKLRWDDGKIHSFPGSIGTKNPLFSSPLPPSTPRLSSNNKTEDKIAIRKPKPKPRMLF